MILDTDLNDMKNSYKSVVTKNYSMSNWTTF